MNSIRKPESQQGSHGDRSIPREDDPVPRKSGTRRGYLPEEPENSDLQHLSLGERMRQAMQNFKRRGSADRRMRPFQELDVDESDEIMVLEDLDNGREYYLFAVDRFTLRGRPYAVLASYEPDEGSRRIPDLVIMRYRLAENGQQYYTSIRSVEELDEAFDVFYDRLEKGLSS